MGCSSEICCVPGLGMSGTASVGSGAASSPAFFDPSKQWGVVGGGQGEEAMLRRGDIMEDVARDGRCSVADCVLRRKRDLSQP